jgi:hypothetical protein
MVWHEWRKPVVATMAGVSALETVRLAFMRLAAFLDEFEISEMDREFALRLIELWDERLMALSRYSTDESISEETREALRFLTDAISGRPATGGEYLQWLAVFPETAAGLFLPFDLVEEEPAATRLAGNRQSTLALAA